MKLLEHLGVVVISNGLIYADLTKLDPNLINLANRNHKKN